MKGGGSSQRRKKCVFKARPTKEEIVSVTIMKNNI